MNSKQNLKETQSHKSTKNFEDIGKLVKRFKDEELLFQTEQLVKKERHILTRILHLLREIERRKLFSDLGYQNLFEYAVQRLGYSEGAAGRRIQAMRLIKEIPEVEEKVQSGKLSLSNLSQLQSYFRQAKEVSQKAMKPVEKLNVIKKLEDKSTREGQKILLQMQPQGVLPKERERVITENHTEVRFVMTGDLKEKLEEVRSLLGSSGANMSLAKLIDAMASSSIEVLKEKKFGKRRIQGEKRKGEDDKNLSAIVKECSIETPSVQTRVKVKTSSFQVLNVKPKGRVKTSLPKNSNMTPAAELRSENPRYISKNLKYQVWQKDEGKCTQCGTQRSLQYDHIKPLGIGGRTKLENLRLLCFQCNQREAMKIFGVEKMYEYQVSRT